MKAALSGSRRGFLRHLAWAAGVVLAGNGGQGQKIRAAGPALASLPPKLKVTDIKVYPVKSGAIVVEVFTGDGITGFGECSPMTAGSVFVELIDKAIRPLVVGQNPFDVEKIWRDVFFRRYKLGPMGIFLNAMAGVDIALWDIMGKALGVPCYRLLGGKVRDKVPLYASAMRHRRSPVEEAKHVASWIEKGFTACKIHPFRDWAFQFGQTDDDTLDVVREVRAAIGPKIKLGVDVNNAYTVDRALEVGRGLEKLGANWFEEPIAAYDYDGYARLCAALEIPVAAGEQEYTRWQFKDLIEKAQVDIIQPDVIKCGGLTELRKIGVVASLFNRPIKCHNSQPNLSTVATYHFALSEPMCLEHQEYVAEDIHSRDRVPLLTEPLPIKDGFLQMPDRPGLGVEIDRKALKKLME